MPPPPEQAEQRYERSERRTSISGNHAFRFDCERYRLTRGAEIGFTLAEILITLGIIGIIASLTIPNVTKHYRDKAVISGVKQAYSILGNAFMSAQNEYGPANTWAFDTDTPVQNGWYNYFSKFMQIKECTNVPAPSLSSPCYSSKTKIKSLYNGNLQYGITWTHGGKLNNGMYVLFHTTSINYRSYGNIVVDINGEKGPNTYGKDIFSFHLMIEKDWARNQVPKLKPEGLYKLSDGSLSDDTTDDCLTNGNACTGWVIKHNNVDYLHCKDYLIKTGEHSCKK